MGAMENRSLAAVVLVTMLNGSLLGQAGDPLAALTAAETVWQERKPQAYEFTIEVRCFCPLADHAVSFRVDGQDSQLVDDLSASVRQTYEYYNTVDKLLAILRRTATNQPFKMVVSYDPRFGYPVQADLDRREHTADDELFFRVTAFKVLPRRPSP
jgi:hypothetical protein